MTVGLRRLVLGAAMLLTITVGMTVPADASSRATSERWCWCTEWVQAKFGLSSRPDAADFGPVLKAAGFTQVTTPQLGDVVVFARGYFTSGDGKTYGHIAEFREGRGNGSMVLRGANQLDSAPAAPAGEHFGCSNVTDTVFAKISTDPNMKAKVTFWRPPQAPKPRLPNSVVPGKRIVGRPYAGLNPTNGQRGVIIGRR